MILSNLRLGERVGLLFNNKPNLCDETITSEARVVVAVSRELCGLLFENRYTNQPVNHDRPP